MSASVQNLTGKTALVTGASRGIGRAIAVELARRGAHVFVNYRSGKDQADETAALCRQAGGTAEPIAFDVADAAQVSGAIEKILGEKGALHILVNNAGVNRDQLLVRTGVDDWNQIVGTNLSGAFFAIKTAARAMMKQRGGAIINISSVVGESGNPGQAAYSASKAGLLGLTKSVAKELGSRGVRANAVCPGFIETDMTGHLLDGVDGGREALEKQIPLGRIGKPEEVAAAVAFLASDEAAYITGTVLNVNGGLYM